MVGFVNDPHPAAADLANDVEIAKRAVKGNLFASLVLPSLVRVVLRRQEMCQRLHERFFEKTVVRLVSVEQILNTAAQASTVVISAWLHFSLK